MTSSAFLILLLTIPLFGIAIAFAAPFFAGTRGPLIAESAHVVSVSALAIVALVLAAIVDADGAVFALGGWLHVDAFAAILVVLIGVIGLLTGVYSLGYIRHGLASGAIGPNQLCRYYGLFNFFLFTMLCAVTANNIILMWAGIEATTLGSTFLVGFYRQRASLEAAWKYVIICTVGVGFGLYAAVLVYAEAAAVLPNPGDAALWTAILPYAGSFDPGVMRLAFVFALIGFGTKASIFPLHAWQPDADSEAPSPVAALLSGVLTTCALFILVRYSTITTAATGSGLPQALFVFFGALSIAVCALFIFVQTDIKRLLAYSTTENVGMIVLGFGVGGRVGVAGAILHMINHSFVKSLMFCGSGNILMKCGTRDLRVAKGLMAIAPVTGLILMAGALALSGAPPFNLFVSEFMVITAGVHAGYGWLMVIVVSFLTVTLTALTRFIWGSLLGPRPEGVLPGDFGALQLGPLMVLLAVVLLLGVTVPGPVVRLVENATSIVLRMGETSAVVRTPWQDLAQPTLREDNAIRPTTAPR
jgi:hydrogenase-4 component F